MKSALPASTKVGTVISRRRSMTVQHFMSCCPPKISACSASRDLGPAAREGQLRHLDRSWRIERAEFVGVAHRDAAEHAVVIDAVLAKPPQRGRVGVQRNRPLGFAGEPVN